MRAISMPIMSLAAQKSTLRVFKFGELITHIKDARNFAASHI